MELFREYALLIAVSLPVLVILAMNVLLFAAGERGSLLLPSSAPYPSVDLGSTAARREPQGAGQPQAAEEDEHLREAA